MLSRPWHLYLHINILTVSKNLAAQADSSLSGVQKEMETDVAVAVADYGNDRIQKFSSDGAFITKWVPYFPVEDIAVDSSGCVYVVDSGDNRIQKFSPPFVSLSGTRPDH